MKNNSPGQSKLNITHLVPFSSMTDRDCKYVWGAPFSRKVNLLRRGNSVECLETLPQQVIPSPRLKYVRLSIAAKSRWIAMLLRAGGSSGLTPAIGLKSIGVGADSVRAEIPGGFGSLSKNASGCPRYAEGHRLRPKSNLVRCGGIVDAKERGGGAVPRQHLSCERTADTGLPGANPGHRTTNHHIYFHHYYTLLLSRRGRVAAKLGIETGAAPPLSKGERNRKENQYE